MSRVQLALNVDNLEESIAFYSTLFATQPAKIHPGYAAQCAPLRPTGDYVNGRFG